MCSLPFVVHEATVADIPALVSLMRDFYAESNYALDSEWAASSFRTLLSDGRLGGAWLAAVNGVPAGYVVLAVRYAMEYGGMCACIDDLFVRPQFRRQGIASALLNSLRANCAVRGCLAIQVEVGRENLPAMALYRRHGLYPATDGRLTLYGRLPDVKGGAQDGGYTDHR